MKKFLIFLGFFLVGLTTANSQILLSILLGDKLNSDGLEFGLETDVNWSTISNLDSNSSLSAFNIGFYFDFRLKNQWYLYTGVLVKSNLGTDKLSDNDLQLINATTYTENGDYSQKINYFLVPAFAKYKFDNRIYVEAGPQFGLMYRAFVEYTSEVDGRESVIKESNKDLINRLDAGAAIGMGYTLREGKGVTIGLKYYMGFVDVYKNISGTKNNSFFIKANIPMGGGKKKSDASEN